MTPAALTTRLLVVRHGESEWNALGKWQGTEDPPLSEAGMRQADTAAQVLGTFDAIWCSQLERAVSTAVIISERLGIGPVLVDDRLRESYLGSWQGLTAIEIEAGWPGYLAQHRPPDDAEPRESIVRRVSECMIDIAEHTPGGEVLVVAHAGVIRTMRRFLSAPDVRFANLSGCWFAVDAGGTITAGDQVVLSSSADSPSADSPSTDSPSAYSMVVE